MTRNELQTARFHAEPTHVVRSVGNCVGLPAFRNTNRAKPAYRRKKDRIARRNGFMNAAHQAIFRMLRANAALKQEESQ